MTLDYAKLGLKCGIETTFFFLLEKERKTLAKKKEKNKGGVDNGTVGALI